MNNLSGYEYMNFEYDADTDMVVNATTGKLFCSFSEFHEMINLEDRDDGPYEVSTLRIRDKT